MEAIFATNSRITAGADTLLIKDSRSVKLHSEINTLIMSCTFNHSAYHNH